MSNAAGLDASGGSDAVPIGCAASSCSAAGGRCVDETCVFDCEQGDVPCNNDEIVCPPGFDCVVNCIQDESCTQPIRCPAGNACSVNCLTDDTCTASVICRGSTACNITCDGQRSCSQNFALIDVSSPLSMRCNGGFSCTSEIDCSDSDGRCDIECGGPSSCSSLIHLGADVNTLQCTGFGSCLGGVACNGSGLCEIDCGRGACGSIECGETAELPQRCTIGCEEGCNDFVSCRAGECEVTCNNGSCSGEVSCRESGTCDISCGVNSCFGNVSCGGLTGTCSIACTDLDSCFGFVQCTASDSCNIDCGPSTSCVASATCSANQVLGDCR